MTIIIYKSRDKLPDHLRRNFDAQIDQFIAETYMPWSITTEYLRAMSFHINQGIDAKYKKMQSRRHHNSSVIRPEQRWGLIKHANFQVIAVDIPNSGPQDAKIAGFITGDIGKTKKEGENTLISHSLFIAPEYRTPVQSSKIAQMMVRQFCHIGEAKKCERVKIVDALPQSRKVIRDALKTTTYEFNSQSRIAGQSLYYVGIIKLRTFRERVRDSVVDIVDRVLPPWKRGRRDKPDKPKDPRRRRGR